MHMPQKTSPSRAASVAQNRKNIYLKNPRLYAALQMAVEKRLIRAASASARIEELLVVEIRRMAPAMRKAGIIVPPEALD